MTSGKYRVAKHCGGLKECLASELPITKDVFEKLISSGIYKFYAFDERINSDRYLLVDLEHNYGLPGWINVYRDL